MFFTGLKDDLIIISARKKLIIQIIAVILLISFANIHFTKFAWDIRRTQKLAISQEYRCRCLQ